MKNNKFAKSALIVLAMVLVCIVSVTGTLAYLTSKTEVVTNTLTVGDVKITLDEAPVGEDGQAVEGDRVMENEYKLFPGKSYDKDPTVHVDAKSENAWLFVKVENGIAGIEADGDTKIETQMAAKGWTLVDGETNIYAYKDIVKAGENIVVFDGFAIDSAVDNTGLAAYDGKTITVQALAVQAEGFATSALAFNAVKWPA